MGFYILIWYFGKRDVSVKGTFETFSSSMKTEQTWSGYSQATAKTPNSLHILKHTFKLSWRATVKEIELK